MKDKTKKKSKSTINLGKTIFNEVLKEIKLIERDNSLLELDVNIK
jgi:hypothetical protein